VPERWSSSVGCFGRSKTDPPWRPQNSPPRSDDVGAAEDESVWSDETVSLGTPGSREMALCPGPHKARRRVAGNVHRSKCRRGIDCLRRSCLGAWHQGTRTTRSEKSDGANGSRALPDGNCGWVCSPQRRLTSLRAYAGESINARVRQASRPTTLEASLGRCGVLAQIDAARLRPTADDELRLSQHARSLGRRSEIRRDAPRECSALTSIRLEAGTLVRHAEILARGIAAHFNNFSQDPTSLQTHVRPTFRSPQRGNSVRSD